MTQDDAGEVQQGAGLIRRAHELLDRLGEPATEEQLLLHLFGATTSAPLWTMLLRKTLRGSTLFEERGEPGAGNPLLWSLKAWNTTQRALDDCVVCGN